MKQISQELKDRFAHYGLEVKYFDAIDRPMNGMNFQIDTEDGDTIASIMSLEALEQWLEGADFVMEQMMP